VILASEKNLRSRGSPEPKPHWQSRLQVFHPEFRQFEPYPRALWRRPRCVAWDAVPVLMVEHINKGFCFSRHLVMLGHVARTFWMYPCMLKRHLFTKISKIGSSKFGRICNDSQFSPSVSRLRAQRLRPLRDQGPRPTPGEGVGGGDPSLTPGRPSHSPDGSVHRP
jgi:hypothetical protein